MKIKTRIERIPMSQIEENPWNPNVMSDQKFNQLTQDIEEKGFIDPIQVVPMPDGKYRIIGGAHRYNAALILGFEELPAVIMDDPKFQDVDLQKFVTLRLNLIKGKMTSEKFRDLYEDLSKRYDEDFIKEAMSLVNREEWNKIKKDLLGEIKNVARDIGIENFDETVKELKTIDDVTKILEHVFHEKKEKGGKIVAFGSGGGKVVYFDVDDRNWKLLQMILEQIRKNNENFGKILEKKIFMSYN
jgi:hypothetical protein